MLVVVLFIHIQRIFSHSNLNPKISNKLHPWEDYYQIEAHGISVRQNSQSSGEVQDQQLSPFWYVLAIDFSESCASTKLSHLYQSHWIELILKVLQYTRKRRCFNFTMLAIWWSLRSMYIIINLLYSTRENGVHVCGGTVHT